MTELTWLALRAAGFVLLLQSTGATLFLVAFAPPRPPASIPVRAVAARAAFAVLGLLPLQYLAECAHLAGEWSGIADTSLQRLLWHSATGAVLVLRLAAGACVALALTRAGRTNAALALAGVLLVVSSFLVSGHTAAAAERGWLAPLLGSHLLVLALWFGSLLPLRQLTRLVPPPELAGVLQRFSALAVWLVPLIALAGATIAYVLLPGFAALRTPYGLLLCGKALLFALLMGLAGLNRLRFTPALARGDPGALPRLRGCLALEYTLIVVALSVTALMTGFYSPTP